MARDILVDGRTLYVGDDAGAAAIGDDGGLYHRDTRHLSTFETRIEGTDLGVLGDEFDGSNRRTVVAADVASGVNSVDESNATKRATLTARVTQTVREGAGLGQTVEIENYATPFDGRVVVEFDADFADVFEVRGFSTGIDRDATITVDGAGVVYSYEYADAAGRRRSRSTVVEFGRQPDLLESGRAAFDVGLDPGETASIDVWIRPFVDDEEDGGRGRELSATGVETRDPVLGLPSIDTGRDRFDRVFERARADIEALTTATEHGPIALAGAPWFDTVFGRDALIAAYQMVHVEPSLARGSLRYLAAHQGTDVDEMREEEPGKIFHEERHGELAHRELVPHAPYYGSIDATALWVLLLAELWRWTGDDGIVRDLGPALADGLAWIETASDRHGDDPFLYYDRSPGVGLRHKAWRDTPGSVQFPDGTRAETPIASVEVQGYVYRALTDGARLYDEVLSDGGRAADLRAEAESLATAFENEFWLDEASFYAVAKAGDGDVVPALTSNVGHCLWTGIVSSERAASVAETLLSDRMFSGWGLRTMATPTTGYSPTSYHLGSVWPHDTSLAALGLAAYGRYDDAETLSRALLDASTHFDNDRIPELFCGFDADVSPKTYPTSCVPQAWSAAAPFAVLRAGFGLVPTPSPEVHNQPDFLDEGAVESILANWGT